MTVMHGCNRCGSSLRRGSMILLRNHKLVIAEEKHSARKTFVQKDGRQSLRMLGGTGQYLALVYVQIDKVWSS